MKKYLLYGMIIAILASVVSIYSLTVKLQQERTKQAAIHNPAIKKAEVVERVITKVVTKEGETKVVIQEIIRTVSEKTPTIPDNPNTASAWYVSGTYGYNIVAQNFGYGIGIGANITDWLSTGLRYDTIGQDQRVAVEVRVNF